MRPIAVALPCPHRTLSLCPSTAAQGARRSPTRCTLARRAVPMRCIQPGRRGVARADGPRRTGRNGPAASAGARRVTSLGAPSGSRAARVDIGTQAAATLHALHGRRRSAQGRPLGCARPWWTARRHPSALARSCRALRGAARGRPRYAPAHRSCAPSNLWLFGVSTRIRPPPYGSPDADVGSMSVDTLSRAQNKNLS